MGGNPSGWLPRGGTKAALTVGLRADEAGGGAVKEGEKASHGQADVGVSWPQVQSGEARDLDLQNVLWSHLDVRHLQGAHRYRCVSIKLQQQCVIWFPQRLKNRKVR